MIDELNFTGKRQLRPLSSSNPDDSCYLCLVMIADYLQIGYAKQKSHSRLSVSKAQQFSALAVKQAEALGLSARPISIDNDELFKLNCPALLLWNDGHFAVLESATRKVITVYDPSAGKMLLRLSDLPPGAIKFAFEVTVAKDFVMPEIEMQPRIRDLWGRLDGFWGALFHVLILSFILQAIAFSMPLFTQLVIDQAIGRGDSNLLFVLAFGFGILLIVQALSEAIRTWTLSALGQMLSFQLISNLVRHLLRLSTDWFEKRDMGDILSRIQSMSPIQDLITRGAVAAALDGFMGVVAGIILFLYSPLLALVVFSSLAISLAISFISYPIIQARTEEQILAAAKESTYLMETIRASITLKILGGEAQRLASWRNLFANKTNLSFEISKFNVIIAFLQSLVFGSQTVIVTYLAAKMILGGEGFSIGMLFAFMSFRSTFTERVAALINQVVQFKLLGVHLRRIGGIIGAERDPISARQLSTPPRGRIELQEVRFRYSTDDRFVLNRINLDIKPGEFVALVGASGEGKSTLCKIILGLYPPTSGQVLLDDVPALPEDWIEWRRHVGVVTQDDKLMSGSIADNIAFFDTDLDMEKVQHVSKLAQLHDEILRLPDQYHSLIGDMGSSLSGGQRQRTLLARALYRNPSILILDEGTANLDPRTEGEIIKLIASLPITRLVIAHSPAFLSKVDRVLQLKDGVILESK